jgi:hypothetical protein
MGRPLIPRRALLLPLAALPLAAQWTPAEPDPLDPWQQLASVWNPFAEKLKHGVVDVKLWKKVVAQVDRIEDRKPCRRTENSRAGNEND